MLRSFIVNFIDFFYPPFRKLMPLQTFRYIACGGGNTLLDICLFFLAYNFIFAKKIFYIFGFAMTPHIAALLFALCITFPIGFLLSKYVVFEQSNLRGKTQLIRYLAIVIVCIFLNYLCLKIFVERFGIYPTVSKILTTVIVVCFSYVSQKRFSFKVSPVLEEAKRDQVDSKL
ncbi:MAG TPA: GtrA family protein [Parasegetibacter sp.]